MLYSSTECRFQQFLSQHSNIINPSVGMTLVTICSLHNQVMIYGPTSSNTLPEMGLWIIPKDIYIKRLNKTAILLVYDPSSSAQIRLASFRLWFTSTIKNFQIRIGIQGIDSRSLRSLVNCLNYGNSWRNASKINSQVIVSDNKEVYLPLQTMTMTLHIWSLSMSLTLKIPAHLTNMMYRVSFFHQGKIIPV